MRARKKPVEITYIPITRENKTEILELNTEDRPVIVHDFDDGLRDIFDVEVQTLEGVMIGKRDKDVLIVGVDGEVYPCKIDIFEKTYDKIDI